MRSLAVRSSLFCSQSSMICWCSHWSKFPFGRNSYTRALNSLP
uniref:Uncharacterized protein n=1 Tax=Arundo donax TaxID=35708 RepID=A0A0A9E1C3_ARUDO